MAQAWVSNPSGVANYQCYIFNWARAWVANPLGARIEKSFVELFDIHRSIKQLNNLYSDNLWWSRVFFAIAVLISNSALSSNGIRLTSRSLKPKFDTKSSTPLHRYVFSSLLSFRRFSESVVFMIIWCRSKICVRPYLFITHVITDGIELDSDLSPLVIFARSVANFLYHTCKISIFEKTDNHNHFFYYLAEKNGHTILQQK